MRWAHSWHSAAVGSGTAWWRAEHATLWGRSAGCAGGRWHEEAALGLTDGVVRWREALVLILLLVLVISEHGAYLFLICCVAVC